MKKPSFTPPVKFQTKPVFPDNLEDCNRLLAEFRDYSEALEREAARLQSILDQAETKYLNLQKGAGRTFSQKTRKKA